MNYGDNFLAKAHNPAVGFGLACDLIKINKFGLGLGYNFIYYSVNNIEKAGNINSSRYHSIYGNLSYEIPINEAFSIAPHIGLGAPTLYFKSGSQNFGSQNGTEIKLGFYGNYRMDEHFSFCLGVEYLSSTYSINTIPAFIDYYSKANAIQVSLGIVLQ